MESSAIHSTTKLDDTIDDDDLDILLQNKQAKMKKEAKKLYEGITCQDSLFIFSK